MTSLQHRRVHFRDTYSNLYSTSLDGSSKHINVGDHSAFSFGTGAGGTDSPFTTVTWMKRTSSAGNQALLGKFANSVNVSEYYLVLFGTSLWYVNFQTLTLNYIGRSAPMATTGSWIGIATTYDASKVLAGCKIYSFTSGGAVTRIDNANIQNNSYTGMSNTISDFTLGCVGNAGNEAFFFNGKLYHQQVYSGALTSTQLGEIAAEPRKDARTYSFGSQLIFATRYINGQSDYPTLTDYKGARNGTLHNCIATDIDTDIP